MKINDLFHYFKAVHTNIENMEDLRHIKKAWVKCIQL